MVISCFITNCTGEERFAITDRKLYVPVVTLSSQDNIKLLWQLKSGFKGTINQNKHQLNPKTYAQNRYLINLVDPSFQGVNRPFVLSFENEDHRRSNSNYYLPEIEINDYNVIDGEKMVKSFFDHPRNDDFKTLKY